MVNFQNIKVSTYILTIVLLFLGNGAIKVNKMHVKSFRRILYHADFIIYIPDTLKQFIHCISSFRLRKALRYKNGVGGSKGALRGKKDEIVRTEVV